MPYYRDRCERQIDRLRELAPSLPDGLDRSLAAFLLERWDYQHILRPLQLAQVDVLLDKYKEAHAHAAGD